ncbi:MAG: YceI family protein [Sciscionella sp.]
MVSSVTPPARVVVPSPGNYRIDPQRCTITFATRHLFGLGAVNGTFALREGTIHVADPVQDSWARAAISVAGFRSGNPGRDAAVLSDRLLAAERHPDIAFASTRLECHGERWVLRGSLSVRGITREISVPVDASSATGTELRVNASLRIDRFEFGIRHARGLAARYLDLQLDIAADMA